MKEKIKLDINGIERVKEMILEIKENEHTGCPPWDCDQCYSLFPKTFDDMDCPCEKYEPEYLIKRLEEIIKYNEEEL